MSQLNLEVAKAPPQKTQEQSDFIQVLKVEQCSIALNAVAGSGKTTTLVLACNELQPKAGTMLALAFNKKNAVDLEKKLPNAVDCMTLNSLGHRAWQQRVGKRLTLDDKKVGTIASKVCKDYGLEDSWAELKNLVNHAKNVGLVPEPIASGGSCIGLVQDEVEEWENLIALHNIEESDDLIPAAREVLKQSIKQALDGCIDFQDQLYMTCCFRAKMPQYQTVMVDEAQDLSEIQHELISRCVKEGGRLIAVGDPKQAIYGFRGAHSNSMEVLSQRFSMKQMTLSYSFRCPRIVIQMAQKIVPQIQCPENTPMGIFQDFGIDKWDCQKLKAGSTVICRNVAPLVRLGLQCFRANVSCWVAVRDMGAPLIKACKDLEGSTPTELFNSINAWIEKKKIFANGNLEIISRAEDTADALKYVVEQGGCSSPGDVETKLRQLFSKDSGSILLTTIHRAKGAEWPIVYLLDPWRIPARFCVRAAENDPEGCGWMLDQERNLRYIAYTRAMKELYFISYREE